MIMPSVFDQHLQQVFGHHIPVVIATELGKCRTTSQEKWRLTDLRRGTGLEGKEVLQMAAYMLGDYLSENILLKAKAKQFFHHLIPQVLLVMTWQGVASSSDLVTVADIARLSPVSGLFAFSVESADELPASDDTGYCLRSSGRYAHRTGYMQQLAG